jgi:hypothetical protein
MKKHFLTFAIAALALSLSFVSAQTPATGAAAQPSPQQQQADPEITPNRALGDVVAINAEAKDLSLKTKAGNRVLVVLNDATVVMRTQPGATNVEGATKITLADISVGDRVLAMGRTAADLKSIPARTVIVMTKADIAKKHERDRAEW